MDLNELDGIKLGDEVVITENCTECFGKLTYDIFFKTNHLGRKGKVIKINKNASSIVVAYYKIKKFPIHNEFWVHQPKCLVIINKGFNPTEILNSVFK